MRLSGRQIDCVRGGREVFSGLDFEAASGEVLAVTGPNGAGKTSLLRLIAGLLVPAGGSVGLEGGETELTLPEQSHYLGHRDALKPALSVAENLSFWRDFLGGDVGDTSPMPRGCGPRSCHSFAGGLSVGRPATAAFDRTPARGAAAGLAAGRTDLGARCRRAGFVRRSDARPRQGRRHRRRRHPHPARNRHQGIANGRREVRLQPQQEVPPRTVALSVPSPLAGEGQGEGCPTTCSIDLPRYTPLVSDRFPQAPFAGPPLSPALPHKGGGSDWCSPRDERLHGEYLI